jgi:hypothetical protein
MIDTEESQKFMNAAIVSFLANGAWYWSVVSDEFLYREEIEIV